MSKGHTVVGVLAGLAAGVILGVLFAPAKGSETRQKISDSKNEFAEILKKKFDDFIDRRGNAPVTTEESSENPVK